MILSEEGNIMFVSLNAMCSKICYKTFVVVCVQEIVLKHFLW